MNESPVMGLAIFRQSGAAEVAGRVFHATYCPVSRPSAFLRDVWRGRRAHPEQSRYTAGVGTLPGWRR